MTAGMRFGIDVSPVHLNNKLMLYIGVQKRKKISSYECDVRHNDCRWKVDISAPSTGCSIQRFPATKIEQGPPLCEWDGTAFFVDI